MGFRSLFLRDPTYRTKVGFCKAPGRVNPKTGVVGKGRAPHGVCFLGSFAGQLSLQGTPKEVHKGVAYLGKYVVDGSENRRFVPSNRDGKRVRQNGLPLLGGTNVTGV